MRFVNRGVPGQSSSETCRRFGYDVRPLRPNIVLLQIGVNDVMTAAYYLPTTMADTVATCRENIRWLAAATVGLGATALLTTIFPVAQVEGVRDVAQGIDELNSFIHTLAAPNVVIFDAYAVLEEGGFVRPAYMQDFAHLNANGYRALNAQLGRLLTGLIA
jgi:lysophospholipase L1-like esterase